jgi:hypothetical protein
MAINGPSKDVPLEHSEIRQNAVVYSCQLLENPFVSRSPLDTLANPPSRDPRALIFSLVLHALILLVLAWSSRSIPGPAPDLPAREVGIVLTESPVNHGDSEDQEALAAPAELERDSGSDAAQALPNRGLREAIPGQEIGAELALPGIQLPGDPLAMGPMDGLVVEPWQPGARPSRVVLPGLGDDAILAEEAARRAARGAAGPSTQLSVFGSAAATGHSFVFAIDRSGSMGGDGLNVLSAARSELTRALAHLLPTHRFQVVAYHHQCVYIERPRLLPASEENKRAVAPFLGNLAALGGSGHDMALRAALALEPDVVFLLSDGGDPYLTEIEMTNLKKLAAGGTSIHCVQFGFGPAPGGEHFMKRLAAQNSGSYTYVDMATYRKSE